MRVETSSELGGAMRVEKCEITHSEWLIEGGIEGATHDETLAQECQKKRIAWIVDNSEGVVLEVGCNYGYIVAAVQEKTGVKGIGVDINLDNVLMAIKRYDRPNLFFLLRDITTDDFDVCGVDTVILPDVLEHLPYEKIRTVFDRCCTLARRKVLITLPWEVKKCTCFKHSWLVSDKVVKELCTMLRIYCPIVEYKCDGDFIYIIGIK